MKSTLILSLLLSFSVSASRDYIVEGTELVLQRDLPESDVWKEMGRSVGVVIYHPKNLREMNEGELQKVEPSLEIKNKTYKILGHDNSFKAYIKSSYGSSLCEKNQFYQENLLGECSVFVVGEKKVMTAGHCLENFDVTSQGILLDGESGYPLQKNHDVNSQFLDTYIYFKDADSPEAGEKLDPARMYRVVKIIEAANSKNIDYAIVEVDRKIEGRKSLKVASSHQLEAGDEFRMIGYPLGLPLTHSLLGEYAGVDSESRFRFNGLLSVFGGFSGAPIFRVKTKEVVGVLNTGQVHQKDEFVLRGSCMDFYIVPREEAVEEVSAAIPSLFGAFTQDLEALFEDTIYGNYIALKLNDHRDWGPYSFENLMKGQDINALNRKYKLIQKSLLAFESNWPEKSYAGIILWKLKYYGIIPTPEDLEFAEGVSAEARKFFRSVFKDL